MSTDDIEISAPVLDPPKEISRGTVQRSSVLYFSEKSKRSTNVSMMESNSFTEPPKKAIYTRAHPGEDFIHEYQKSNILKKYAPSGDIRYYSDNSFGMTFNDMIGLQSMIADAREGLVDILYICHKDVFGPQFHDLVSMVLEMAKVRVIDLDHPIPYSLSDRIFSICSFSPEEQMMFLSNFN